MATGDM